MVTVASLGLGGGAGGSGGTPAGADGAIQYNNGGVFGGFGSFDDITNTTTVPGSLNISTYAGAFFTTLVGSPYLIFQPLANNTEMRLALFGKGVIAGGLLIAGLKIFQTTDSTDLTNSSDFGMFMTSGGMMFNRKVNGTSVQYPIQWLHQDTVVDMTLDNTGVSVTNALSSTTLDVGRLIGSPIALANPIALFSANVDNPAGIELQNTSGGTSADSRFVFGDDTATSTTGSALTLFMPSTGNTGALFGETRSGICGIFTSTITGTPRKLVLGTVGASDLILGTSNTTRVTVSSSGAVTFTGTVVMGANFHELTEMAAPGAGAANTARIFAQDNGGGKTQLMVIFNTGAAQQIAIQP